MSAGKRIKTILSAVSSNRVVGCLTGAFVTALVQSSSATTVMLIGFVTAGLMTLQQAVGMILGANIGTTVTAQLIAFKLTDTGPARHRYRRRAQVFYQEEKNPLHR